MLYLLGMLATKKRAMRGDLLPEWSDSLHQYTHLHAEAQIKDTQPHSSDGLTDPIWYPAVCVCLANNDEYSRPYPLLAEGEALLQQHQYTEALEVAERALQLDPGRSAAYT